ncbi:FAD-binding oxidoreductase [Devosia sp. MC1541]|uniref:NAD(P)/FAD-dependent oxidoreductase n=1 Tax=Devosia sp. MC1541 TaxID=2725264 RepID=UPI00145C539D|nr:FAD-binding oxidoreductase [Devosia sp. MC1541]
MDSIVIGAGMVGVSTALALQERGHNVVLVDRSEPGRETSYGNAGIIQTEAVQPYVIPLSIPRLARIALGNAHDVAWKPTTMHHWLSPLARYFWSSLPANYGKIVPHYAKMILRAADDHAPLIAASGADEIIDKSGFIQAYRTAKGFDGAHADARGTLADYGVPFTALTGAELAKLEPSLRVTMEGAIHYNAVWSCKSPGELVKRYAALFIARGGQIETATATSLTQSGASWTLATDKGSFSAQNAVVALGPWAPHFLKPLGYRVGMIYKRGYHQHFETETAPSRPVMDVDNSTVLSPMKAGLRVLTGAELNSVEGEPNYRQIKHSAKIADELFGIGAAVEDTPWRGARPCMPGMLPVVGKAPKHEGLWFNFGHGHQGFTLGPTTGRLVAEAMRSE